MSSPRKARNRIDVPMDRGRSMPSYDAETFGRISESVARYIGSWGFIAWMTVVVFGWVAWNTLAPVAWRPDPFPFIFLTLLLSLQASYAAPLILLAQTRQTDRDRVTYAEDRARTERLLADTDDVGSRFAEEARKIHYGEVPERGIRGRATPDETDALLDEGIAVLQLPLPEALKGQLQ